MNTPLEQNTPQSQTESHAPRDSTVYEAPAIESVLSSEDIEREVQYAGVIGSTPVPV